MEVVDGMGELSKASDRALFSRYPEWRRYLSVLRDEETGADYLQVEVPQEGTDRFLYLSTANGEITMGFDYWHTHVGPFLGLNIEESVAQAMTTIESFMNEETVVTVCRRDGVWIRSGLDHLAAPSEPMPNSTTEFFSWRRTHDKAITTS
jgi:hypothetical protein